MTIDTFVMKTWKIDSQVCQESGGLNKGTWRIGQAYWLSSYGPEAYQRLKKEVALYKALEAHKSRGDLDLPYSLETLESKPYLWRAGAYWRVSRHVAGQPPHVDHEGMYKVLACGLASLHLRLKAVDCLGNHMGSILKDVRGYLQAIHKHEEASVEAARQFLNDHMAVLEDQDFQVIHGDFSHPNLRVRKGQLTGVIDFEFASVDPPILDLATLGLTLVCRSKLSKIDDILHEMVHAYASVLGQRVDYQKLLIAMVVRKYDSYHYHKENYERQGCPLEVVNRQVDQLKKVMNHLDLRTHVLYNGGEL